MKYKFFFFACALNLFYYVPNLLASPIIGGQEDTFHTYKYHVSIQYRHNFRTVPSGEHLCGGTIINDRYVLSAAHPFLRIRNGQFERVFKPESQGIVVLSGTSEVQGPGIITPVDRIFIPYEYTAEIPAYGDLSVLKLSFNLDVELNRDRLEILPIERGNHHLDFFVNKNAFILGNGYDTLVDGELVRSATRRQVLQVQMTPRDLCPPFDYAICAVVNLGTPNIGTCCRGDSGSPIVFDHTVVGVVTLGPNNVRSRRPIKCTRTSTYINFIDNAMNELGNHFQMYILDN